MTDDIKQVWERDYEQLKLNMRWLWEHDRDAWNQAREELNLAIMARKLPQRHWNSIISN